MAMRWEREIEIEIEVTELSTSKHQWSSGRIVPCHGTDPGLIPGWCRVGAVICFTHKYVMAGSSQSSDIQKKSVHLSSDTFFLSPLPVCI
uniref:Uncharacterized protein n=1 Tax=Kalanchoe fedtschenkoi TaxID=63787 RepID=A0A7N0V6A5_KALFE